MGITIAIPGNQRIESDADSLTVGHDPSCGISFPDDPRVKQNHALIRKIAGRWMIEAKDAEHIQVGPEAPTRVHWLKPGDVIQLTPSGPEITFEPLAPPAANNAGSAERAGAAPASPLPAGQYFQTFGAGLSTHLPDAPAAESAGQVEQIRVVSAKLEIDSPAHASPPAHPKTTLSAKSPHPDKPSTPPKPAVSQKPVPAIKPVPRPSDKVSDIPPEFDESLPVIELEEVKQSRQEPPPQKGRAKDWDDREQDQDKSKGRPSLKAVPAARLEEPVKAPQRVEPPPSKPKPKAAFNEADYLNPPKSESSIQWNDPLVMASIAMGIAVLIAIATLIYIFKLSTTPELPPAPAAPLFGVATPLAASSVTPPSPPAPNGEGRK